MIIYGHAIRVKTDRKKRFNNKFVTSCAFGLGIYLWQSGYLGSLIPLMHQAWPRLVPRSYYIAIRH